MQLIIPFDPKGGFRQFLEGSQDDSNFFFFIFHLKNMRRYFGTKMFYMFDGGVKICYHEGTFHHLPPTVNNKHHSPEF